jgi:hypothetical protein
MRVHAERVSAGSACSWFVAPRGSVRAGGRSENRPTTLRYASRHVAPGDVVCLLPGVYRLRRMLEITRGGTADSWIVYRSHRGRALVTPAVPIPAPLIQIRPPAAYLQFSRLSFDGGGTNAYEAVLAKPGVHHVSFLDNEITNMGAAGFATVGADYVTVARNKIYRFGDGVGWASGISLNSNTGAFWSDTAPGFHNIIADNFIAGGVDNSTHHSDGNGIVLDLGRKIPPTLIANNVVYMNGGRGIVTVQTSGSVYVLNNTLYKNGLDLRLVGIAEAVPQESSNQVWANDIAVAWEPRFTYQLLDGSSAITYIRNAHFGGKGTQFVPTGIAADPARFKVADPLFLNATRVDPTADGQWRTAPSPARVSTAFALRSGSPLIDVGVDPRTLPGLDAAMVRGIDRWVMTAVDGTARPAGNGFDLGAYER